MKRSPLKKRSKKQAGRMAKYVRMLRLNPRAVCARCRRHTRLDPHHPKGRSGEYLYYVVRVCRFCHCFIHDNQSIARSRGWLHNEFYGLPHDPSTPIPWRPTDLITLE